MVAWDGRQSSYENRFVSLISVSQKRNRMPRFYVVELELVPPYHILRGPGLGRTPDSPGTCAV